MCAHTTSYSVLDVKGKNCTLEFRIAHSTRAHLNEKQGKLVSSNDSTHQDSLAFSLRCIACPLVYDSTAAQYIVGLQSEFRMHV